MKNGNTLFRLLGLFIFVVACINLNASEHVKKSIEDPQDESNEGNDETKDSMDIMVDNENTESISNNINSNNNSNNSNVDNISINTTACSRRMNSQMHEILAASPKQFPFMAAIMSHQHEYLCSGCVVSNGLILTSAECLQKPISYILLNTTKAKKEDHAVMLHVKNREKFPSYAGADDPKDIGIIYTDIHNNSVASKIRLSNITKLKSISDFEGLGYGLNAEVNQARDLQYIGVENRAFEGFPDLLEGYFDCVDTKIPTCFRDIGGPAIFDNELIGVISQGQEACTSEMSAKYAVSKKLVKVIPTYVFKAWLDEKITKNEMKQPAALATYPSKLIMIPHKTVESHAWKGIGHKIVAVPFLVFIVMLVFIVL